MADVSAAIVASGAAAATVISTQVQPAAATCASPRSGVYRFVDPPRAVAGVSDSRRANVILSVGPDS